MYEAVLARLSNVRGGEGHWEASCPAHDDQRASLSLSIGDAGKLLVRCHAGCTFDAIRSALGIDAADFFPPDSEPPCVTGHPKKRREPVAVYDYRDENGVLLYQVLRFDPKDFRQRKPDGKGGWVWSIKDCRRVLYGLPEILAASPGRWVFLVEGEKDVWTARGLGLIATTASGGASQAWEEGYSRSLIARNVVVIPDNDEPGYKHALKAAAALRSLAKEVVIVPLYGLHPHGDLTDWVASGGTKERLQWLVKEFYAHVTR